MIKTKIIAGFPCTGKTHLSKNHNTDMIILDSDSSHFSWIYDCQGNKIERNPDFPKNYINYIKSFIGKADVILTSTHPSVIQELLASEITVNYVRPQYGLLEECINTMKSRGDNNQFISKIIDIWAVDSVFQKDQRFNYIELGSGEFLNMELISTLKSTDEL